VLINGLPGSGKSTLAAIVTAGAKTAPVRLAHRSW
jgi:adenylate kinase family enzyme